MPDLQGDIPRFVVDAPRTVSASEDSQRNEAAFRFADDFIGFNGHFPGNPILPGIAQIMLAQYTAACGRRSQLVTVDKCKFMSQIKPQDNVTVQVEQNAAGRCKATVMANGEKAAQVTFTLTYP